MSAGAEGRLNLRPVTAADARIVHAWRNDPDTRVASRNGERVEWADHQNWLDAALKSPDRMLWIAEIGGSPVGVLRADRTSKGWELSWTVAPEARGRGIGREMTCALAAELGGCVSAVIRRGHLASEKIAYAAGLRRVGMDANENFDRWERQC